MLMYCLELINSSPDCLLNQQVRQIVYVKWGSTLQLKQMTEVKEHVREAARARNTC